MLTLVALLIGETIGASGDTAALFRPLVLAISLFLVPIFWSRRADPFELGSFNGLSGAIALASTLVMIVRTDGIDLAFVPQMSPRAQTELVELVAWSYVAGQASYLVGYYWPRRARSGVSRLTGIAWSSPRLLLACLGCLAIALPVYIWFQGRLGTDLTDFSELARGKAVVRDDPNATWILRGMSLGFIPAMFALVVSLEKGRRAWILASIAMIAVFGLLVVRAGQRGLVVIFFVGCAACFHYMRRRIPWAILLAAAFASLVASNIAGQYRAQEAEKVEMVPIKERLSVSRQLEEHAADRQRLSALALVFYYFPEKKGYLYGESWAALLTWPIPKWVWADKTGSFIWRDSAIVFNFTGASVPTPFLGVLFANFSWFGVVLGMMGWGAFQRRVYQWMLASRGDKNVVMVYASTLFVSAPTTLPLSLLTQFALPVLGVILFAGYRPRGLR